jgi:hypothetical protein
MISITTLPWRHKNQKMISLSKMPISGQMTSKLTTNLAKANLSWSDPTKLTSNQVASPYRILPGSITSLPYKTNDDLLSLS